MVQIIWLFQLGPLAEKTLPEVIWEWVVNSGSVQSPELERSICAFTPLVGLVLGFAVYGPNIGTLIEIEVTVIPVEPGLANCYLWHFGIGGDGDTAAPCAEKHGEELHGERHYCPEAEFPSAAPGLR